MPSESRSKVLITGCGRSGTRYIVALLIKHGLDVRHEELGRDGVASWTMAVDSTRTPWGPGRRGRTFDNVFHQVRSPLKVIPSMAEFKDRSWRYICKWIPCEIDEPPLLRAAKYWYHWNVHAEKIAQWRYRVEDFKEVYPEFCARLGITADHALLEALATDINTRSHGRLLHLYDELCLKLGLYPVQAIRTLLSRAERKEAKPERLTWPVLENLDAPLTRLIQAKAQEYGYVT
jgi:hypothetical protein